MQKQNVEKNMWMRPNPVMFGCKTATKAGEVMCGFGCRKVLLVYDAGLKQAGIADRVGGILEAAGLTVIHDGTMQADPRHDFLDQAIARAKADHIDGVVGLGGGSSIDSAKAIGYMMNKEGSVADYLGKRGAPGVPTIALPTTAGTGSEVSGGSIIVDANGFKVGLPTQIGMAIIDPELMMTAPAHITAACGMDAMAHAVEAFLNVDSSQRCDVNAQAAITRIVKYLPNAVQDGRNLEARENMAAACTFASMAMSECGVGLGHAAAQVLAEVTHLPHGVLCGLALPEYLRMVPEVRPERVRQLLPLLGVEPHVVASADDGSLGCIAADTIHAFLHKIDFRSLKELGVERSLVVENSGLAPSLYWVSILWKLKFWIE